MEQKEAMIIYNTKSTMTDRKGVNETIEQNNGKRSQRIGSPT